MATFLLALMGLGLVIGMLVVLSIARGFVLSYLWEWFIVPFGLFELSIAHAIGISLIVSFLTYELPNAGEKEDKSMARFGASLLMLPMALLVGYIAKSFM